MSVIGDIASSYRGPQKVIARHLAIGPREDRALAILMAGCILFFVASWPQNARVAHLEARDITPLMGASLFALLFIAPLGLYLIAAIVSTVLGLFGWKGGAYASRISLFWALLASTPLLLVHGLVKGFLGVGIQEQILGLIWFIVFMWFWMSGLFQSGKDAA